VTKLRARHVVWDWNGTLLDDNHAVLAAVNTVCAMYETSPVGKYKITLCTNLPCQLGPDGGSDSAAEYLKQKLGIDFGETTPDGKFTLKEGECMGSCGDAPVMLVNNHRMCSFMSRAKIDQLLEELSK